MHSIMSNFGSSVGKWLSYIDVPFLHIEIHGTRTSVKFCAIMLQAVTSPALSVSPDLFLGCSVMVVNV